MHVLAVASQKGGSGKTTLAGHMAVQAELAGDGPVALIDADPQGSLSEWWNEREADKPRLVRTTVARLAQDVRRLRAAGIRLLFIDTPPAITSTIGHVIEAADLVVIPTRPSPHDLRAVGATVELAERMAKPLVFVINGSAPRARLAAEAAVALAQFGPLAPTIVHQRTDFAASMIDGRTVMELKRRSRSPDEMVELWRYLRCQLLKRPVGRRKTVAARPAKRVARKAPQGTVTVNADARPARRSPEAAAKPAARKSASRPAKPNGAAEAATGKTKRATCAPKSRKTVDAPVKPAARKATAGQARQRTAP